jgi:hypothetical protein
MYKTGFYINWSKNTLFCFQEKYVELYFSDLSRCGKQGKNEKRKKIEVGSDSTPCLEVVAIGFVTCRQIISQKNEYSFAVGKKYKSNEKR